MHWYIDERLSPEARRFVLSLPLLSVEDWVTITKSVMFPDSPYNHAVGGVMWRVMEVASSLSIHPQLAAAQISAVDAIRSLDWAAAEAAAEVADEDEDEDSFYLIRQAKGAAESAAHNAAGVIVTMASLTARDCDVAFAPFRDSKVDLPD